MGWVIGSRRMCTCRWGRRIGRRRWRWPSVRRNWTPRTCACRQSYKLCIYKVEHRTTLEFEACKYALMNLRHQLLFKEGFINDKFNSTLLIVVHIRLVNRLISRAVAHNHLVILKDTLLRSVYNFVDDLINQLQEHIPTVSNFIHDLWQLLESHKYLNNLLRKESQ